MQVYAKKPNDHRTQEASGVSASSSNGSCKTTADAVAVDFALKRDALLASIDTTNELVSSLSAFNDEKWSMLYPHRKLGFAAAESSDKGANSSTPSRITARRSATTFGDAHEAPEHPSPSARIKLLRSATAHASRSASMDDAGVSLQPTSPTVSHPLAIDLKLGAPGSTSIPALMENMSQATIAQLLSKRFDVAKGQLRSLEARVRDNQSRILVTGDLNAGKSTLINALLRRNVLPTDQQALTNVFCEVLDAQSYNGGKEEIHAILAEGIEKYSRDDKDTYERFELGALEDIVAADEQKYGLIKVYLEDSRAPVDATLDSVINHDTSAEEEATHNKSFIRNGIVSISLIDGPGLNKDDHSTTAIFTRQTEIDVIVFVIDGFDGFTESSQAFLDNAAMDKAYIFMVINKFGSLKRPETCRKRAAEKIPLLSLKTWQHRDELVHFVEAEDIVKTVEDVEKGKITPAQARKNPAFTHLEESLRSFVMQKRTISKLTPARHYLLNLLSNLSVVAETNIEAADREAEEAAARLEHIKPIHEKLERERDAVEEAVGQEEDVTVSSVKSAAQSTLEEAVKFVGAGGHQIISSLPDYPGLLNIWEWANTVKSTLADYIESKVVEAEEDARSTTKAGVDIVMGDLANRYLPKDAPAVVATSANGTVATTVGVRVFKPDAMFKKARKHRQALLRQQRESSDRALLRKDATLLSSPEFELSFLDLFDLDKIMSLPATLKLSSHKSKIEASQALSVVSLGAGALTMFGTRVIGLKSIIESVTTALELLGSRAVRKWAPALAGLMTIGLAAYIIHDLPRAIPHNIGKRLHASLQEQGFTSHESERIAAETRKVMRLAGWDLRERFRAALEASEKDRRGVEGKLHKADEALRFLDGYLQKVEQTRENVTMVEL